MFKKSIFFFFLILINSYKLISQTLVFAEIQGSPIISTAGWNLTGAAAIGDTGGDTDSDPNELILTQNVGTSSGGIFYSQPIDLSTCYQWNVEFDFRMFDGNAADGIAFCFLDVPPTGFVNGGGMGIPEFANGIKVVFDTWDNGCGANPEIQIYNGIGYNECSVGIVKVTNTAGNLNFLRSNTYNHAEINYNNGIISVSVNGTLWLSTTYTVSFVGYMGFTASTGGSNDRHSIKNATIYADIALSNAGPDISICNGQSGQIGAIPNSDYLYSWSPSNGLNDPTISNPVVSIVNNGTSPISQTYTVQTTLLSNPTSCPSNDNVTVTINPILTSYVNASICAGSSYTVGGQSFSSSGNFQVIIPDGNSCDSIIQLTLTVNPALSSNQVLQICQGSNYNFYGQTLNSPGNYTHVLQTVAGCDSLITLTLSFLPISSSSMQEEICAGETFTFLGQNLSVTGSFPFTIPSANGCDSIITVSLLVNPIPPAPSLSNNSPLKCPGDLLTLSAVNIPNGVYNWSGPANFTSNQVENSLNAEIENIGIYTATVSLNGCISPESQINVLIENIFTFNDFDFPNVITADGDGVNDSLNINDYFNTCLPFELFIYNRWGNLVFEQVSNELPFTGKTKNGQDLQQGIYLFKLIYENGEKSGFIHLIR
jgi:gliding motility-associated-like protein